MNLNKLVLLYLNLDNPVSKNRNLNYSLDLSYDLPDHLLLNYLLDYLRHLNNFLNHSWHNHDFLNDFLHLDNFRDLDHLLDYFLSNHAHLLDSVDHPRDFNDFLFEILNCLGHLNVVINQLFDFNYSWLMNNQRVPQENLLNMNGFHSLDNRLLNYLSDSD